MSKLEDSFALQMRALKLPEHKAEYRFHPVRRWRLDFAFPEYKIGVEIDGGTYAQGRHTRGKGFNGDCHKINSAICLGWRVLRGDAEMVNNGDLLDYLIQALWGKNEQEKT